MTVLTMLSTQPVFAVRPFITDDAALTGFKRSELASWIFTGQSGTEIWHSANFGLTDWAELTIAGIWGSGKHESNGEKFKKLSYMLPLIQAKFLFRNYEPNGLPGIGMAVGADMPWGKGVFVSDGCTAFGCLLLTQCLGKDENVLIHAQAGGTYLRKKASKENLTGLVFGLGTQVKVYKGFHLIGEVVNGDPYDHGAGSMYQLGIRQFISEKLQIDCAYGNKLKGASGVASWLTAGFRYVVSFDKRNNDAANRRKIS